MRVWFNSFCTARCRASIDIPDGTEDILEYIAENLDDAEVFDITYYGDVEEPEEYEIE